MPRSFLVKRNGVKEDTEQVNNGEEKAVQETDSSQYLEYAITLLALSKNSQWSWDYELEKSYWFDTTSKGTFTALLNDDKPEYFKSNIQNDVDLLSTVNALTTLKDSKIIYSAEKKEFEQTGLENKENKTEFYQWLSLNASKNAEKKQQQQKQQQKQQQQQQQQHQQEKHTEQQPSQSLQQTQNLFITKSHTLPQNEHIPEIQQQYFFHQPSFNQNLAFTTQLSLARLQPTNEKLSDKSTELTSDGSTGHTSPESSISPSESSYTTGHSSPDEGIMVEEVVVDISSSEDINGNVQQFLINNPLAFEEIAMETGINKDSIHTFVKSLDALSEETKRKIVSWYTVKILKQSTDPSTEESYTCPKCGKIFTYRSYLERHIKYVCPDSTGRTWKCSFCGKAFQYPCYLRRHIRSHTGESPYKCEKCDRAFVRSTDLQRHIRNHTGEKPYRCTQCSRAFARSTDLKRHMRTHTGEKPYKCWKCGKSFSQSGSLQTHLHTHEKDLQAKPKKRPIGTK